MAQLLIGIFLCAYAYVLPQVSSKKPEHAQLIKLSRYGAFLFGALLILSGVISLF